MHTHELIFTRQEGLRGVTTVAVVQAEVMASMSDEDCLGALKRAVTEWILQDPYGQDLWMRTSKDLNIGDLSSIETDWLMPYLRRHGIVDLHILYCGGVRNRGFDFDTVLAEPTSS